jgi:transcriptional regulator with XRE-family HTH domain
MTIDLGTTAQTPPLSEKVAEEIRALMARRMISGRQLATLLGVSPSWVSYRLTGMQPIDLNDLAMIAHALGARVLDLLPRELEDEEPPPVPLMQPERHGRRGRVRTGGRGSSQQLPDVTHGYPSSHRTGHLTRPPGHSDGLRRPARLRRPIAA